MRRDVFRDRVDAGRRLAERLRPWQSADPLVVGLPRGGVPVAAEVAQALRAPLDVVVIRKVGVPWQPELAMGAVGEDGVRVLNDDVIAEIRISAEAIEEAANRAAAEVEERLTWLRGGRPAQSVQGRTVILIDDGIATGATARAAAQVLRHRGAARVVLATPVAAPQSLGAIRPLVDEIVCLSTPEQLGAIGWWYEDFTQVSDEEVVRLLAAAAERATSSDAGPEAARNGGPAAADASPRRIDASIALDVGSLPGTLTVPEGATGVVLFAHGSGSSRLSPRNVQVADRLHERRLATLLFDLLTPAEADLRANVFDVTLLAERLSIATEWIRSAGEVAGLPIGYFGASTGAAAALWAAAEPGADVGAVVSRGGRPDLAAERLPLVTAPTLLVVGSRDVQVLELNRWALARMRCEASLEVVAGATHLFEEPGALDTAASLAAGWFTSHLRG